MKTYKEAVSEYEVAESLPVNKWFYCRDIELVINLNSLRQRVRRLKFVVTEKKGRNYRHYLSDKNKIALLKHIERKEHAMIKPKKQKIVPREMTEVDRLFNIMMGVAV